MYSVVCMYCSVVQLLQGSLVAHDPKRRYIYVTIVTGAPFQEKSTKLVITEH